MRLTHVLTPLRSQPFGRRGLTMVECLVGVIFGAMIFGAVSATMNVVAGQSAAARPTFTYTSNYGTNVYQLSPSPIAFGYSAPLLNQFQASINSAAAVFVLGGYRSSPGTSPSAGLAAPVTAGVLFSSVTGITSSNLPQTSSDLRTLLSAQAGVTFESTYGSADFTVVTLTGLNTVSSITQCRKYSPAGDSNVYYEVVFDNNLSAARNATVGAAGQNRWAYRFAIPSSYDTSWVVSPGALHFWFRYDSTWQRMEEAPARLIFPDPYVLAGTQATVTANGSVAAVTSAQFSRFIFAPGTTNN